MSIHEAYMWDYNNNLIWIFYSKSISSCCKLRGWDLYLKITIFLLTSLGKHFHIFPWLNLYHHNYWSNDSNNHVLHLLCSFKKRVIAWIKCLHDAKDIRKICFLHVNHIFKSNDNFLWGHTLIHESSDEPI